MLGVVPPATPPIAYGHPVTLADALLVRPNGLTVVRIALASLVIALHSWTIGGFDHDSPFYLANPLGQWAVPGFFCLSGFLIARSRMRLPMGRFLWHRTIRIFPAYLVCLAVIAFALAPLSTMGGGTWRPSEAWDYLLHNAFLLQLELEIPGTLGNHPWDVSLWTLSFEFLAYLLAGVLLIGATHRQATGMTLVMVALLTAGNAWAFGPGDLTAHVPVAALQLGSYFASGMLLYFVADRMPCRASWALGCATGIAVAQLVGVEMVVGPLPLAYLVLWAGATIPARWAPHPDLSYGIYIYAFPVQVLLEWFLPDLGLVTHSVSALLLTLPFAYLSWHLVERPVLRLKSLGRTPARSGAAPRGTPV